ncbi:cadherin-87A-like [Liolophura sinensis]|uniref:cadherin-87A-like n=1 Tax=Liolophura sinensis TaxID=3198878 RepID=UPI0031597A71
MSRVTSLGGACVLGIVLLTHTALAVNKAPVWDITSMNKIRETFTKQVYENTTENKLLGTLLARDPEGKQVTYGVDSENTVKVNETTGEVRLARFLDREKGDTKVDVTFYAQDPLEPGSNVRNTIDYFIRLDVQDVNDNAPDFKNLPYGASVKENGPALATIFTSVRIEDLDDGYNAEVFVNCSIFDEQSRIGCEKFGVSELKQIAPRVYTCSIYTKTSLDYEDQSSYIVTLLAWDNGVPRLSSQVNIHIRVIDVQDSPPEFLNTPINLYTNESAAIGSKIGEIQARDRDQGNPRPIKIVMLSGTDLFELSPQPRTNASQPVYTYDVKTKGTLDRELLRGQAAFDVRAIELQNGVETNVHTNATVLVNIFDINDNAPTFDQMAYYINATESVRATDNTQIPGLTMTVRDLDDASNARFSVSIQSQTFPGAFAVSPTNATSQGPFALAVINADYMDYEVENYRQQQVVVVAREYGTQALFSTTATVFISLIDVNDNSPKFEPTSTIRINENEGPMNITRVTATDADSGSYGQVTYSIDSSSDSEISEYFQINPNTGDVRLVKPVNYEENRGFAIVITASDGGSPKRTDKVEHVIGYHKFWSRNTFVVNPRDGRLSLSRKINFNETPNASDNGNPPMASTVTVRVNVQDENNFDARFDRLVYSVSVSELAPRGYSVIRVNATDEDAGENGRLRYSLQGSLGDFSINPQSGLITVNNKLDSVRELYRLIVVATDNGSPRQRSSSATVNVNILDKNNKLPYFPEALYTTTVSEGEAADNVVLKVSASDPDQNSSLIYSILNDTIRAKTPQGAEFNNPSVFNYKQSFYIDGDDGEIHIRDKLSYEHVAEMDFAVQVRDVFAETTLEQTATASVNIRILGSVDATPQFVAPWTPKDPTYYFTIPEETAINNLITTLVATDPIGQKPIQNFKENVTVDERDYFTIDSKSGALRVNARLDYEQLTKRVLPVNVMAISGDSKKTAFARIRIQIQDINDNRPVFDMERYDFEVYENREYPYLIGNVYATDADSGVFKQITYTLGGQGAENFEILDGGKVIVAENGVLDREKKSLYQLTVTATDNPGGRTQRQGSAQLVIVIKDENDETPKFTRSSYSFLTVDSALVGSSIGQVEATDLDTGLNARIFFSMNCDNNANSLFSMNFLNGEVIVEQSLEGKRGVYLCRVSASDNGRPQLSSTVLVQIQVSPASDNGMPVFSWPYTGYVAKNVVENANPGVEVGYIQATSLMGNVSYGFVDNSDIAVTSRFQIDPDTGRVTTITSLDREEQDNYELLIYAQVLGNSTLSSVAVLRIDVQDVNDNIPVYNGKGCDRQIYVSPPYKVYRQEDTPVGRSIMSLSACDSDDKANTITNYKFVTRKTNPELSTLREECVSPGNSSFNLKKLDNIQVSIEVRRPLDHEASGGPVQLLCIHATDARTVVPAGRRKRQAELYDQQNFTVAYIEVHVVDVNDNKPIFPEKTVKTVILEFPQTDSVVIAMTAKDADSSLFNKVRYSIQSTYFRGPDNSDRNISIAFDINSVTGDVTTKLTRYTQFLGGTFYMGIRAEDNAESEFFDTAQLQITVLQVGQRYRVTWDATSNAADASVKNAIEKQMQEAVNARNWQLSVDELRYHVDSKGVNSNKFDACFVVVDSEGRSPSKDEVIKQIQTSDMKDEQYQFGLCDVATSASLGGSSSYWWVLIALAILIFIGTLILIIIVFILAANLRKKQKYERTTLIQRTE